MAVQNLHRRIYFKHKKRLLTQLPLFTDTGAPSTTATVSLFASVGQFYKHHQTHLETSF